MSRPRTPTNILELKGAFKKDPQRKRVGEPKPERPLGKPPERLSDDEVMAWEEIATQCASGVLTGMDRAALETVACAFAWMWKADNVTVADRKTILTMLGKFGMTPSDRAGLSVAPPPKRGDFDDYE